MIHSRLLMLILGSLAIVLMIAFGGCSKNDDSYSSGSSSGSSMEIEKYCYSIPEAYWPKIKSGGTASAIAVFVALIVGIVIYIIGYFSGVRVNKPKVLTTIFVTTTIAVLARSIEVFLRHHLTSWLAGVLNNQVVAAMVVDISLYILWITFIAGIAVHLYETLVITTKETFGGG